MTLGRRHEMRARADIHFHLLPGVDDGPATPDESVALARRAAAQGTADIVATPHVRSDFPNEPMEVPGRARELSEALAREGVKMTVTPGAELGHEMVGRLSQAQLDAVAVGPAGARWLLVESPFDGWGPELHDATEELRDRGFTVVLAHPERSVGVLREDVPHVQSELARGTLLQVNATSLAGDHGDEVRRTGTILLAAGMVEAIASDAHSLARGPALMRGARTAVRAGVPAGVVRRAVEFGPTRLLRRGAVPGVHSLAA